MNFNKNKGFFSQSNGAAAQGPRGKKQGTAGLAQKSKPMGRGRGGPRKASASSGISGGSPPSRG